MIATVPTPLPEPTADQLLTEQFQDPLYRELASTVGILGSHYSCKCKGFQVHVAPIDGAVPRFIPQSFQPGLLVEDHYSHLAEYPHYKACTTPHDAK